MWVNSKFLDSAAGTHDFQKIFEFGLESVQFDHNQIEWHAIKIIEDRCVLTLSIPYSPQWM